MTRKDLLQMIEDEVSTALKTTVTEPVPLQQQNAKPIQKKANLSDDELDEVLFFGGKKPEEHNDLNIQKINENLNRYRLNDEQIKSLQSQPESGMGYKIVDVLLNNGKLIKNVIVLNDEIIETKENINPNEINKIIITNK